MAIALKHIEQIEALARLGSFGRAARELYISQPALSRSISTLEARLGVKLFDRLPGGLVPTRFAAHILDHGKAIMQNMQLLHRDLALLRGLEAGELSIGCGPFPAETFMGEALAQFNLRYPKLTVNLTVDLAPRLVGMLRERSLDFFVGETRQINKDNRFDIINLPQQQGYFCCRNDHPLCGQRYLAVQELFDYPLALMWLPEPIINLLSEILGQEMETIADIQRGLIRCDNLATLLAVISASDAVGITTREVLDKSFYRDRIALLPLTLPGFTTHYGIVSLKGFSAAPAINELKLLVRETAKKNVRPL